MIDFTAATAGEPLRTSKPQMAESVANTSSSELTSKVFFRVPSEAHFNPSEGKLG